MGGIIFTHPYAKAWIYAQKMAIDIIYYARSSGYGCHSQRYIKNK